MTDFKEQMIRNIERGFCSYSRAYEFTRDQYLDAADLARARAREANYHAEVADTSGANVKVPGRNHDHSTLNPERNSHEQ
jgi:hypothetical protein